MCFQSFWHKIDHSFLYRFYFLRNKSLFDLHMQQILDSAHLRKE